MDIRNCSRCGRIFTYDGVNKLCLRCRRQDEEDFIKVREYLYDNPNSTIHMVSEDTGVDTKKILKFLREGRLELKDEHINFILDCERCGKPIKTGRFCDKCKVELERELKGAAASSKRRLIAQREKERMYIADRYKK